VPEPGGVYFEGPQGRKHMERLLIVEGPDDAYFFDAIFKDISANPARAGILYLNGKDALRKEFGPFIKSAPFTHGVVNTYAIVKDADLDPNAAIVEAHAVLRSYGEPEPPPATFVAAPAGRAGRVGLLIIPSATEPGDLEEVCFRTVAGEVLTNRVSTFLAETEASGGQIDHLSKRRVQTYLANKHGDLCRGPGRGFSCGHFNASHQSLVAIKDFCRQLIA
jgi:hypothetical protein